MGGTVFSTMPQHNTPPRDSDGTPTVPEPTVEPCQSREAIVMGSWKVVIALAVLSAACKYVCAATSRNLTLCL